MITKDRFSRLAEGVARNIYPHVPWEVRYNRGEDTLELWAAFSDVPDGLIPSSWDDLRCVSWAVWLLCERNFGEPGLAELMTYLGRRLDQMFDVATGNRLIAKRKAERRLEAWRQHFGILAEVAG